jgi:hypothetical protein
MSGSLTPIPHLCVVGHPNRGKSSLVSTLTENDNVRIGTESGTTTRADTFEFVIDQRVLLQLTDTPGFQRARQVLAWLQRDAVAPAERPMRVRQFLTDPANVAQFPDEVALLMPIMAGAGILYVVDGAQPVSPADEAEMEILRWTGQPRMAVINPMGELTAVDQWQATLEQFFQWVRIFNPLTASLAARHTLLRAMGELHQGWSAPIRELCTRLDERDQQRIEEVSFSLANYWCAQISRRESVTLLDKSGLTTAEEKLRRQLDEQEALFFKSLSRAWGHTHSVIERDAQWELGSDSLMNTETWYLWGLKQRDLLLVSGAAGATTGLIVDAGLGGSSFMLGAVSGGVIGSVGGWIASRQLPGKRIGWLPLTQQKQFAGPVQHPNFPLVVMARALTLARQIWSRAHAERGAFAVRTSAHDWPRQQQVQLLQWAKALQQDRWKAKQQDELVGWIEQHLRDEMLLEK